MSAVVIGGGLAGLTAARTLRDTGEDVVVLEAARHLGGMIARADLAGVLVDTGAEAYATRSRAAAALCADLRLEVRGPSGQPHVWWSDQIVPLADGVLGIPGSLDDPALQRLTKAERARLAQDLDLPPAVGADATTAGALAKARMGAAVPEKLMAPLTTGVYRSNPMDLPLATFAPTLQEALRREGSLLAAVSSLRAPGSAAVAQPVGGMWKLIDALAFGLDVRTDSPVLRLSREGNGFLVHLAGEDLHVGKVVIATPALVAARLLSELGVQVPTLPTSPAHVALLASDHPGLAENPVGSGLLMGERDPAIVANALTHYTCKWPWVGQTQVLRLSYNSQNAPGRSLVIEDASRLTKLDLAPHILDFTIATHQMPAKLLPSQREELRAAIGFSGVDVVGAWIDGNGIGPVIEGVARIREEAR